MSTKELETIVYPLSSLGVIEPSEIILTTSGTATTSIRTASRLSRAVLNAGPFGVVSSSCDAGRTIWQ